MESSDYQGTIRSFEHTRAQMRHHMSQPLFVVSLVMRKMQCIEIIFTHKL